MMPHAGGQYVYLREQYNPLCGFLYGWTCFLVIQTVPSPPSPCLCQLPRRSGASAGNGLLPHWRKDILLSLSSGQLVAVRSSFS